MVDAAFFKRRTKFYLHFDKRLSPSKLSYYISNPDNISRHGFLPFITYTHLASKIHKTSGKLDYKEKRRIISCPSHMDGQIYGYYAKLLEKPYEALLLQYYLQNNITAFCKIQLDNRNIGKSNIHFAQDVFDVIRQQQNCVVPCYVFPVFLTI